MITLFLHHIIWNIAVLAHLFFSRKWARILWLLSQYSTLSQAYVPTIRVPTLMTVAAWFVFKFWTKCSKSFVLGNSVLVSQISDANWHTYLTLISASAGVFTLVSFRFGEASAYCLKAAVNMRSCSATGISRVKDKWYFKSFFLHEFQVWKRPSWTGLTSGMPHRLLRISAKVASFKLPVIGNPM